MGACHGAVSGLAAWGAFDGKTVTGGCPLACELAYFSSWVWGRCNSCGQMVMAELIGLFRRRVSRGGSV